MARNRRAWRLRLRHCGRDQNAALPRASPHRHEPPSGRVVLVNGFDASVETVGGCFSLSSQLYKPDVVHPDGAARIEQFKADPWPQWIYRLEDGSKIQFEIFACNGASVTVLAWRLLSATKQAILSLWSFLSRCQYHTLRRYTNMHT